MTLVLIEKGLISEGGSSKIEVSWVLGCYMLVFFTVHLKGVSVLMFWFILSAYLWTLRGSECGGLLEKKFHVTVTVDDLCLIEKKGWLMLVFLPIASMYLYIIIIIIYLIYLPTWIVDFVDVLLFLSHICMWYICLQWIVDFCGKCR